MQRSAVQIIAKVLHNLCSYCATPLLCNTPTHCKHTLEIQIWRQIIRSLLHEEAYRVKSEKAYWVPNRSSGCDCLMSTMATPLSPFWDKAWSQLKVVELVINDRCNCWLACTSAQRLEIDCFACLPAWCWKPDLDHVIPSLLSIYISLPAISLFNSITHF